MKNVTDFRKTMETWWIRAWKTYRQLCLSSKWESSLARINIHSDQNIDIDIVVHQFAGKHAWHHMLTDLLTELDMRS